MNLQDPQELRDFLEQRYQKIKEKKARENTVQKPFKKPQRQTK